MKLKKVPTYLIVVFLFAVSCILYLNSLHGEFLIDDEPGIVNNTRIHNVSEYFSKYFKVRFGVLHELTLLFCWHISKANPFFYHLFYVLAHATCAVLLFVLCNLLFKNRILSFLSSLIFAVHPIHTEAVSWISGGHYAFSSVFFIIAVIFYVKSGLVSSSIEKLFYLFLLAISCALCLLAGHNAAMLPVVLIFYELFFSRLTREAHGLPLSKNGFWKDFTGIRKFKLLILIFILVIAGVYLATFYVTRNAFVHSIFYFRGIKYLVVVTKAFAYYLKILYLPIARGLYHPFAFNTIHIQDFSPVFYLSIGVVIAAVIAFFKCLRKNIAISFGIMWFFTAYAPFSNIIPVCNIISERYLYLASVGSSIFTAALFLKAKGIIERVAEIRNFFRPFSICVITLYLSSYAALTVKRNYEYSNIFIYWKTNIENFKDGYIVYNNLAATFYSIGNIDNAIAYCWINLMTNSQQPHVWCNLGKLYREQKNLGQAKSCYQEALNVDREYFPALEGLKEVNVELDKQAVAQIELAPKETKGEKKKKK